MDTQGAAAAAQPAAPPATAPAPGTGDEGGVVLQSDADLNAMLRAALGRRHFSVSWWSLLFGLLEDRAMRLGPVDSLEASLYPLAVADVSELHRSFQDFCLGIALEPAMSTRTRVKKVSAAIWKRAGKSFRKDVLHGQSLFSFTAQRPLDCFGITLTTLCALDELGTAVQLTLSEDHAYLSFVEEGGEGVRTTAEMTWASAARRGEPIAPLAAEEAPSWLYMRGRAHVCLLPHGAIAAAAANINCCFDAKDDEVQSEPLLTAKAAALWALRDCGLLANFPFGLLELADGEVYAPTRPNPHSYIPGLFEDALSINASRFGSAQVYPFWYFGHYEWKQGRHARALHLFAGGVRVASGYQRDTHLIALLDKICRKISDGLRDWAADSAGAGLDAELLLAVLVLYDALLLWEERTSRILFTATWTDALLALLALFPHDVRLACAAQQEATRAGAAASPPGAAAPAVVAPAFQSSRLRDNALGRSLSSPSLDRRGVRQVLEAGPPLKRRRTGKRSQHRYA